MSKLRAQSGLSRSRRGITVSSTAEYFSKNLQQVGFSSPTKAVLTTLKEAFDNALDACEEAGILPEIKVVIEKKGPGSLKNTDKISILVEDNGPGIDLKDIPKVFGEYLASSKFGRGRCSRGQQGIGISAATTWALQTTATGAQIITKQAKQRKAISCVVSMDLKNNKGIIKNKEVVDWDRSHGTSVKFLIDGRVQLNGEAGLINYLNANVLVNPHLTLKYQLPGMEKLVVVERVSQECPKIPEAVEPHPHTMKLGEFMAHAKLFPQTKLKTWLKKGFSRVTDKVIEDIFKHGKLDKSLLNRTLSQLKDKEFRDLYVAIQNVDLKAPSTNSVLSIGEQGLSKSILRIGDIDFFSVVTRKPTICDFKPVQVEVAVARLDDKKGESEDPVHVLRFANRVPLQFDKGGCAIVKAISSVNWKNYGLKQPKNSLPLGPYIMSVSVVSPFIKFKNASKETIDSSDELVEEIRRALMQAGQRLARHIKRETKEQELEQKIKHIEKFAPILVETLVRITGASEKRKKAAEEGLIKILGRETKQTKKQLNEAVEQLKEQKAKRIQRLGMSEEEWNTLTQNRQHNDHEEPTSASSRDDLGKESVSATQDEATVDQRHHDDATLKKSLNKRRVKKVPSAKVKKKSQKSGVKKTAQRKATQKTKKGKTRKKS